MAVTKTVLKNTAYDTIVRIVATAANDTASIDLQTDLKMDNETLGATQTVSISSAMYSTGGHVTVARNSVTQYDFWGDGQILDAEWTSKDQATYDVAVTFSAAGMLILHLKKISGFNNPVETPVFGAHDDETAVGS